MTLALFTCAVSRAIHLDLVSDLAADTFLRCFKRFTARFGIPREIKSDNSATFKLAAKTLSVLFKLPEVTAYLLSHRIKWSFNLERAPWWGGFFERLVRCVKRCLKKILGQSSVCYDELLTTLFEGEAILNSRPLTFVFSEDLEEPLTPSHLIYGKRVLSCPTVDSDDVDVALIQRDSLLHRLKHLNMLLDHFWSRWRKEYLLELRNAHRSSHQWQNGIDVCVGDVVVVHDDNERRSQWRLGLVEEVLRGRDGKIRGAVVKSSGRSGQSNPLRRPVQRLYLVEFCVSKPVAAQLPKPTQPSSPEHSDDTLQRPSRAAAQRSRKLCQNLIDTGRL